MKSKVLHGKALRAVVHGAANERTRCAFDGIQFDPDTGWLTATDGKMLVSVKVPELDPAELPCGLNGFEPEEDSEPVLIPLHLAKKLGAELKKCPFSSKDLAVFATKADVGNVRFGISPEAQDQTFNLIEGSFPNFAPIFHDRPAEFKYRFDADYLIKACKAAKALQNGPSDTAYVDFSFHGDDSAALLEFSSEGATEVAGARAAIMPVSRS